MADQIIFTSSVRGIKPGTSGYCTVLRSPGIRSALEHALEKISVFEHRKCNEGRSTYAYRQIEIRDTTYYTLSRVSDAGKDYTGRTNFLAHHLVFQKDELPELTPADILLNWSGWYQNWSGEPREEAVDLLNLQQIAVIRPPVQLWKEQTVGVEGALKLASDTKSSLTLRSSSCTDVMLLQLLAEALAVRAKFNKSYRQAWTSPFSVGLATATSTKSFKWLALKATDDYAITNAGTLIDLNAPFSGAIDGDEELIAIAREGSYRPAPKPIALTDDSSLSNKASSRGRMGGDGSKSVNDSVTSGKIKIGVTSQTMAGSRRAAPKKSVKRTGRYVFIILAVLLLSGAGIWFFVEQSSPVVANYETQYKEMLKLSKRLRLEDGSDTTPEFYKEVEDAFRRLHAAKNPGETEIQRDELLQKTRQIDWEIISPTSDQIKNDHNLAFNKLRDLLLNNEKTTVVAAKSYGNKENDQSRKVEAITDLKEQAEVEEHQLAKPEPMADLIPLDLNQYDRVALGLSGQELRASEIDFSSYPLGSTSFLVATELHKLTELSDSHFVHKFKFPFGNSGNREFILPESDNVNENITIHRGGKIPESDKSFGIEVEVPLDTKPLLLILIGEDWKNGIKLGEFSLEDKQYNAAQVLHSINKHFKYCHQRIRVNLIDKKGNLISEPVKAFEPQELSDENKIVEPAFKAMAKILEEDRISQETLKKFETWMTEKTVIKLEEFVENKSEDQKSEFIINAYNSIINKVKGSGSMALYFQAYTAQLDSLNGKIKDEVVRAKKDVLTEARMVLYNNGMKEEIAFEADGLQSNSIKFIIKKTGTEWSLEYKSIVHKFSPRKFSDLQSELLDMLPKIKANEEYREKMKKYHVEKTQFNEMIREWSLVNFIDTSEGGRVIAIVKLNYQ